jgi:hypothetical protein
MYQLDVQGTTSNNLQQRKKLYGEPCLASFSNSVYIKEYILLERTVCKNLTMNTAAFCPDTVSALLCILPDIKYWVPVDK